MGGFASVDVILSVQDYLMAKRKTTKKKTRKKSKRKVRKTASKKASTRKKRKTAGRRGRRSKLSLLPTTELQAELERRLGRVAELEGRREQLLAELNDVETEIRASGGNLSGRVGKRRGPGRPPGSGRRRGGRGRRPRNAANLVESLKQVLNNKTMSVTEVTEAVQQAGYKTTSSNFRTIVNQALINNPQAFKKVARGQYTAK